jgi:hypothetical protein
MAMYRTSSPYDTSDRKELMMSDIIVAPILLQD